MCPFPQGLVRSPHEGRGPCIATPRHGAWRRSVLVTAVPCPGYVSPSAQGSCTRRPVGPTTSMSPTSRPMAEPRFEIAQQLKARGPTTSPHALSRGKVDLSTKATSTRPRKHKGGDTARWAAPDDEHVKAGQPPCSFRLFGSTVRSSHPWRNECRQDAAGDRNRFAQQLFSSLPKRYDKLAEVLSMGQNGRWRRAMVDHIAPTSPSGCWTWHRGPPVLPCSWRRAHLTLSAWI